MRKMIMVGRVGCGKTTLTQALRSETIHYHKTQYINHYDVVVDTPGEYAEERTLGHAIALYSYECDVVGMLVAANEPYCIFPPGCVASANRPVIGIITKIHDENANIPAAESWLRIAGVGPVFYVDSVTGEGLLEIFHYLAEPGDELPALVKTQNQTQNNKKNLNFNKKPQKNQKI